MPREWLCQGGGGHEDGEDGLRALTLSGEALVETLEAYREALGYDGLQERDKLARELAAMLYAWLDDEPDGRSPVESELFKKSQQLLKLYSPKGSSRASE